MVSGNTPSGGEKKEEKKKNIVGGVGAGDVKDDRMVDERRVT